MATIFSLHNPPSLAVHDGFVARGRQPNMYGQPDVNRAVAHTLHKVGSFTGYLLTGITLTHVAQEIVEAGLVNSDQHPDASAVEREYYAILADGLYIYHDDPEVLSRYRTEYRMD